MATTKRAKKAVVAAPAAVYRRLALALPDVIESSHMRAADFRVAAAGKTRIFATLAYESRGLGTLMLDVAQQAAFLADAPEYFSAVPGGWGRMGATLVRLDAPESVLAGALATAHAQVRSKMQRKASASKAKKQVKKQAKTQP